ncbi:hypothetical protein N7492_008059 [Penicillium capsulatum]|uniref:Uncharacterized protein n=1 Tax=Penicillium capsulatum TaxID=69766 RepID=A0A9W9HSR9_9EURO|nr:hypothetical protein N7492_008059 [Penicillium capsulatum]KAJ6105468.1 hypothetical protein N7512_008985 [Penicillium capsulatum]
MTGSLRHDVNGGAGSVGSGFLRENSGAITEVPGAIQTWQRQGKSLVDTRQQREQNVASSGWCLARQHHLHRAMTITDADPGWQDDPSHWSRMRLGHERRSTGKQSSAS